MSTYSREQVIAAANATFRPEERAQALAILDAYPGDTPTGRARVQLAVLKLSGGELARLRDFVEVAIADFRDVLYAADDSRGQDADMGA
jgi:hypothetical protein